MRAIAIATLALSTILLDSAYAADLGGPSEPQLSAPLAEAMPSMRRLYVRGDVGVGRNFSSKFSQEELDDNGGSFVSRSMGDSTSIGAGIGWQLSHRFRVDLTAEYRSKAAVKGQDYLHAYIVDPDGVLTASTLYQGEFSSTVGLINGYWDIANWRGFTPYIGAGIGMAHNQLSGFTTASASKFVDENYAETLHNSIGYAGNKSSMGLAWALMAGTSFDLSSNAKLDLGYRYLHLGSGVTATTDLIQCLCGSIGSPLKIHDLSAQEWRVGVRWELDAPMPASMPDHTPMK
jgi:opacity protein-like surface antigen